MREHLDGIDELAASMRTHGLLQPLPVNDQAGTLFVTDGHRRLAAARRCALPTVPCLVTAVADGKSVLATMLAAAMHRELTPLEQARAFRRLRDEEHVPLADIAHATGYSPALIRQRLLLLQLPPPAQDLVHEQAITLAQATSLAVQVKATRTGTVRTKTNRTAWFTRSHPLAAAVRSRCTHRDQRTLVGGVGCGQWWEDCIRDDQAGSVEQANSDGQSDGKSDGHATPPSSRPSAVSSLRLTAGTEHPLPAAQSA